MKDLSDDAEIAIKWIARYVYNRDKRVFSLGNRQKYLLRQNLSDKEVDSVLDELRDNGFLELKAYGKVRVTDKGMDQRLVIRSCESCGAVSYGGGLSHSNFCSDHDAVSKHLVGEFLDRGEF